MNKARLNFWLDVVIAMAFIVSAVSGMVFLFAGSNGYQGGRNAGFETLILGISRWTWSDLHTWGSLVMIAGVVLHLVLHWNWIICMVKRAMPKGRLAKGEESCPVLS